MGSAPSATTVSVVADGEDPNSPFSVRRCPGFSSGTYQNPPECQTMQDCCLRSFKLFGEHPYLGIRPRDGEKLEDEFVFKTYKECEEITYNFGSGLFTQLDVKPQDFVGVYCENIPEWVHAIDVSSLYGIALVSLYDTFGIDSLAGLIKHSKMKTIIVSSKNAQKLLSILKQNTYNIENVILVPSPGRSYESCEDGFKRLVKNFYTFNEICEIGKQNRVEIPKCEPEWVYYVCYSSGTTGSPKGVLITQRSQTSNTLNCFYSLKFDENSRHLSYLPLPHVFERIGISITSYVGGRIGFFSGSIAHLMDDMKALKPTHLSAVPRVICRISDTINETLKNSGSIKRGVFWGAWYWKRYWLKRGYTTPLADSLVFNTINSKIGGCIKQFIVGGASMDPWIHEFIQFSTGIPMRVGYGLTEIGAGNICNPFDCRYSKPGTVGGPLCNCEVKLDPLEEYDDPLCGEICMGGQCLCSGYLYDEEQTRKLFMDEEHRWIRTGDVGKWDSDGYLMVVDRIRSIFKLSQGEYVAAELLTQTFEAAPIVGQIFIYGDSSRNCLVAVCVPDKSQVAKFLNKASITQEEYAELCKTKVLCNEVRKQLDQISIEKNLPGYEKIRAVYCESEEWTIDNDLMTPTFKLKRKKLADKYKDIINQLYLEANSSFGQGQRH